MRAPTTSLVPLDCLGMSVGIVSMSGTLVVQQVLPLHQRGDRSVICFSDATSLPSDFLGAELDHWRIFDFTLCNHDRVSRRRGGAWILGICTSQPLVAG